VAVTSQRQFPCIVGGKRACNHLHDTRLASRVTRHAVHPQVDPMLGALFPDLWNFFVSSATCNDTFVAGVDGAGYVYLPELGDNARAYEIRASDYMSRFNIGVVDVGIANIHYPASSLQQMQAYGHHSTPFPITAFFTV
jgi:hypothetical protein